MNGNGGRRGEEMLHAAERPGGGLADDERGLLEVLEARAASAQVRRPCNRLEAHVERRRRPLAEFDRRPSRVRRRRRRALVMPREDASRDELQSVVHGGRSAVFVGASPGRCATSSLQMSAGSSRRTAPPTAKAAARRLAVAGAHVAPRWRPWAVRSPTTRMRPGGKGRGGSASTAPQVLRSRQRRRLRRRSWAVGRRRLAAPPRRRSDPQNDVLESRS